MDFHIYNRLIHWNQCHVIYFSTKTGERAARWKSKIATRSLEKKYALKTKNLDLAFMGRGWQLNSKQIELKCKIAEGSTGIVWVSSFFLLVKKCDVPKYDAPRDNDKAVTHITQSITTHRKVN